MSIHIEAKEGAIAETILLPGDPLRAKWLAETYLTDTTCFNNVRNMLGYTGYYKGNRISVMGTGMGIPSIAIYVTELIKDYGVKNLVRIGSAGSLQATVKIHDIVIAMASSTTSYINTKRFNGADYAPTANIGLFMQAIQTAKALNIPIKAGSVLSADEFYDDNEQWYKIWSDYGVLCVEMETSALYTIAAKYKVNALGVFTISDSLISKEIIDAKDREQSFTQMAELVLNMFC
ncbi:MAG: purine-nucleoside phosphorylase [Chitinophagales bacterium]|nr:purine-nucleoside phosphorylase [Chitinophagales bacterium]